MAKSDVKVVKFSVILPGQDRQKWPIFRPESPKVAKVVKSGQNGSKRVKTVILDPRDSSGVAIRGQERRKAHLAKLGFGLQVRESPRFSELSGY